jgi:hypothetical protein
VGADSPGTSSGGGSSSSSSNDSESDASDDRFGGEMLELDMFDDAADRPDGSGIIDRRKKRGDGEDKFMAGFDAREQRRRLPEPRAGSRRDGPAGEMDCGCFFLLV